MCGSQGGGCAPHDVHHHQAHHGDREVIRRDQPCAAEQAERRHPGWTTRPRRDELPRTLETQTGKPNFVNTHAGGFLESPRLPRLLDVLTSPPPHRKPPPLGKIRFRSRRSRTARRASKARSPLASRARTRTRSFRDRATAGGDPRDHRVDRVETPTSVDFGDDVAFPQENSQRRRVDLAPRRLAMAVRHQYENSNDIGVFANLTNSYCLTAIGGSENFYSVFQNELSADIPVVKTSIAGTRLVGRMTDWGTRAACCCPTR